MKTFMSVAAVLMAAIVSSTTAARAQGNDAGDDAALSRTIAKLDAAVFDAFNKCDVPVQLQKHASYFAPDVEFYHDTGGVTWSRDEMIGQTKQYVCGKFRRELVPGTLKVLPIKNFGAIEQGTHRFCQFGSGKCEGIADFTIVWENRDGVWRITRVLSYGHRAND